MSLSNETVILVANKIQQVVEEEITLMRSLSLLLDAEQLVLIENKPDDLDGVTAKKNTLLPEILKLENSRNKMLVDAGYSSDIRGMQEFLTSSNNENMGKAWSTLLEISASAQEKNRTNGLLIHRQLNRNQNALNILQRNDQSGSIYGADGQAKNTLNSGRGIVAR
jgi:flagella synthesis protein FlgN